MLLLAPLLLAPSPKYQGCTVVGGTYEGSAVFRV